MGLGGIEGFGRFEGSMYKKQPYSLVYLIKLNKK